MAVKHAFESQVTDAGVESPDLVGPNEWNEGHTGGLIASESMRIEDDCFWRGSATTMQLAGGVMQAVSGSGAVTASAATEAGHPGIISLSTGIASTGRCALGHLFESFLLGDGEVKFGTVIKTGANLSDGTDEYRLRHGLADAMTGEPTNGVQFRYSNTLNSGKWQGISYAADTPSTVDLGITVVANTWYRLEFTVNDDASEVVFSINGTESGSITTNIPSLYVGMVPAFIHKQSLGTNQRFVYLDAYWYEYAFSTPR